MSKTRCAWAGSDPLSISYHDKEWGVPVYEDALLFEFLILEGMQAGLNWITILRKRENYRAALDNFKAELIATYDTKKFNELMTNEGIIRNKLKIQSIISNAKAFLQIQQEFKSFSSYIWHFVNGKPIINHWNTPQEVPSTSDNSDQMSKDLKQRGFKFVGSTICYALMQATGMVNDHTTTCFRYNELRQVNKCQL